MIIGIPREVKTDEHRVSLTPDKVDLLVKDGHKVVVEAEAGVRADFKDADYHAVGASIVAGPVEVFDQAELIVKVKEPQPQEYELFRQSQILFTFLHLAAEPELARVLLSANVVGVACETVQEEDGSLPLLYPMSEIAGKLAPLAAARLLQNISGGPGKLLGGVPGTSPSRMVIVGGGTVGFNAAQVATALGADVAVADVNLERLRYISMASHGAIETLVATPKNVSDYLGRADVAVGAVLVPGARAPKVITSAMIGEMREGSIVIDVAIDQGGSVEAVRPTTHSSPTYSVNGVTLYAVPNMPGIVGNTSSISLSNATYPYVLRLAGAGLQEAVRQDVAIARGVNVLSGHVTHRAVAEDLALDYVPVEEALADAL